MATSGLGNLLVEEGLLTEADRRTIRRTSGSRGGAFAKGVLALGLLDEDELAAFLAERTRWRVAGKDLLKESLRDAWAAVDRPLMERLEVVPLRVTGDTLHVAMLDPLDQDTLRQLEFFSGYRIVPVIATASQLKVGLTKLLKSYKPSQSQLEQFLTNHATSASRRLRIAEDPGTPPKARAEPVPAPSADLLDDVSFDDDEAKPRESGEAFDDLDDTPEMDAAPTPVVESSDDELIDEGDGGNHLEDMAMGLDDEGDSDGLEENEAEAAPAADAAAMPGSAAADVLAAFDDPNDIGGLDDLGDLDDVVDGALGDVGGDEPAAPAAPKGTLAAAVDAAGELEGDLSAFDPDGDGGDLDFGFDEEPGAKKPGKAAAAADELGGADDLLGGGDDLGIPDDLLVGDGDDDGLGGDLAFDEPTPPKKTAAVASEDPLAAVSTKDALAADDDLLAGLDDSALGGDDPFAAATDELGATEDLKLEGEGDDPFAAATDDLAIAGGEASADDLSDADDLKLEGEGDDLFAAATDDLKLEGDEGDPFAAGTDDLELEGEDDDPFAAAASDDLKLEGEGDDLFAATTDEPLVEADDLDALSAQDPFETRASDDLSRLSATDDLSLEGLDDDIAVAGPLDEQEPSPAPEPAAVKKPVAAAKPAAAKTAAPEPNDDGPSPAVATLNRALWALTMAATVKDGLAKAAPALAASGLSRGLVVRVSGNKVIPVYYWEAAPDGLTTKDKGLDAYAAPGLAAALSRQFPGWSRLDDNARGDTLKPFAAWLSSGELLAAAVAVASGATLGFVTLWTPAAAEDQVLRTATMDVVRKLAGKAA